MDRRIIPADGKSSRRRTAAGVITAALVLVVLAVLAGRNAAAAGPPLTFGVTPWADPARMHAMYKPLLDYLADATGREFVFVAVEDYKDLGARLAVGRTDFGMFSPAAYVRARSAHPGLRYVASGQRFDRAGAVRDHYFGLIVTLKDGGPRTLAGLKGRRLAFTDAESASGCVFAKALLRSAGLDPERDCAVYYLKRHEKVIQALLKGSVDAVATWDGMLDQARAERGDIFRVLGRSGPIPNDACAAGPHVSDDVVAAVGRALLALTPDSPAMRQAQAKGLDLCAFSRRDDAFYDLVRQAYRIPDRP